MSTLLVATSPGQEDDYITTNGISAGSGMQTGNSVELQVNQATTVVTDGYGVTRQIKLEEVLIQLEQMKRVLARLNWPYAAS
jgi:hypothetical protein